jgi:hypothetical protein
VYGPFFFATPTLTGISFLDMLKNYLILQLQQDIDRDFIFKQDGGRRTSFMRLLPISFAQLLLGLDMVER